MTSKPQMNTDCSDQKLQGHFFGSVFIRVHLRPDFVFGHWTLASVEFQSGFLN